jgi:hypothetical protein
MKAILWISLFAMLIPAIDVVPALSPTTAAAQSIPVDIPDTPGESPGWAILACVHHTLNSGMQDQLT